MKIVDAKKREIYFDDEDIGLISQYSSWFVVCGSVVGDRRRVIKRGEASVSERVLMHRLIMGAKPGEIVHHKDGNGLNNCRSNLVVCTRAQDVANRPKPNGAKLSSSRYKGVIWSGKDRSWRAFICKVHLGYFATEEDAALAYDRAAETKYGEFARLNIPESRRVPVRITRKYRKAGVVLSPSTPNFCRSAG